MNCNLRNAALLLAMTATGCGSKSPPAPIVVGQVGNLSGPGSRADAQASRGMRLALDEINKDAERKIVVRHTDTQGKLDAYESQAARLVAFNRVAAILGGDTAEEVVRLDRSRVPAEGEQPSFLPIVSPFGRRTPNMSAQVVLIGMDAEAQGKALAQYACLELKITDPVLLIHQGTASAEPMAEAFVHEFTQAWQQLDAKKNVPSPRVIRYGGDEGKLSDRLAKLTAGNPPALLFAGPENDLRWLRDHWAEKEKDRILLYAGEDGSLRLDEWGGGPGAVCLASAYGVSAGNATAADFAERFRKAFQEAPDVHAALGYESMKLLAEPLRKAADGANLRDELFKIKDFPGLVGPLSFDEHHRLQRSLVILRLDEKGKHVIFPAKK